MSTHEPTEQATEQPTSFARRFTFLRDNLRLDGKRTSQAHLARYLVRNGYVESLSRVAVSLLLNGKMKPSLDIVRGICAFYEIDLSYFDDNAQAFEQLVRLVETLREANPDHEVDRRDVMPLYRQLHDRAEGARDESLNELLSQASDGTWEPVVHAVPQQPTANPAQPARVAPPSQLTPPAPPGFSGQGER